MGKLFMAFLLLMASVLLTTPLDAQGITDKGVKVGINLASTSGDSISGASSKMGFAVGGFITYSINEKIAIQPEFLYSMKGFVLEEDLIIMKIKATYAMNYLDIPVLGVYSIQENIKVFAGPSLGFFLDGTVEGETTGDFFGVSFDTTWTEDIESENMNSLDLGLVFGGSYHMGQLAFDFRYSMGLSNYANEDKWKWDAKNAVVQLLVGYSF